MSRARGLAAPRSPAGYVALHRAIMAHPVWTQMPEAWLKIWIGVLLMANYRAAKWFDGSEEIEILPGSFVTSLENLATSCGVTIRQIRSCLVYLERSQMVTRLTSHRFTLLTITNWGLYQAGESSQGTDEGIAQVTSRAELESQQGHSEGTVRATTKEGNKERTKTAGQKRAVRVPSLTPQQAEWFEQWWPTFWTHKNQLGAKRAFSGKITTVAIFERVMEATSAQGPEMMERAERYMTGGAAWLADERYNDPPPVASKTNANFDYVRLE